MSDRKAVIKNADMSEEMQQDSVECATQALEKYNIEKDIAAHIKKVKGCGAALLAALCVTAGGNAAGRVALEERVPEIAAHRAGRSVWAVIAWVAFLTLCIHFCGLFAVLLSYFPFKHLSPLSPVQLNKKVAAEPSPGLIWAKIQWLY